MTKPEVTADGLPLDKAPRRIAEMFDAIAGRYDLLNRLLSVGLDQAWRARAVRALELTGQESVLDLCTGTADLALAVASGGRSSRVIGVDFAAEMLRHGQRKVNRAPGARVTLLRGDAMRVPLREASVDAATIGFGIRNVSNPQDTLDEIRRVLRPGGRLAILEFGYPSTPGLGAAYRWYFRVVLPQIGRLVSRHRTAYRYLPASVGTFYPPGAFRTMLERTGFVDVRSVALTFGVVHLFHATKPDPSGDRASAAPEL